MIVPAYGGVVFDEQNRVLLRKVSGGYGGYVWTFAKGRPKPGECPEDAAIREVLEETGVESRVIGALPTPFPGDTTFTSYFLMAPVGTDHPFDEETEEIRWVFADEAAELIAQTTSAKGKKRDLEVLSEAVQAYRETPEFLLNAANPLHRPHARAIHLILTALQPDCVPCLCGKNSTTYIRYNPYPNLFNLKVNNRSCSLHISKRLSIKSKHIIPGKRNWDILNIEDDGAVRALRNAVGTNRKGIEEKLRKTPRRGSIPSGKGALPVLDINLDELHFLIDVWSWNGTSSLITGENCAYDFEELQHAAVSAKETLDQFLTRHVVSGLNSNISRKRLLVWYWTNASTVFLTVIGYGEKHGGAWMSEIPGYKGPGPYRAHKLATPFVYWDSKFAFRVYAPPAETNADPSAELFGERERSNYYVADLGIVPGNVTSTRVKRADYDRIRKDKLEYWAYTAIPEHERECFTAGGKLLKVNHAFCKLTGEFGEVVNSYWE